MLSLRGFLFRVFSKRNARVRKVREKSRRKRFRQRAERSPRRAIRFFRKEFPPDRLGRAKSRPRDKNTGDPQKADREGLSRTYVPRESLSFLRKANVSFFSPFRQARSLFSFPQTEGVGSVFLRKLQPISRLSSDSSFGHRPSSA